MNDEQRRRCERVLELRRQGMSLRTIGREVGLSHQRVRQILDLVDPADRGRPVRYGPVSRWDATGVLELCREGCSASEIASRLGGTESWVSRVLAREDSDRTVRDDPATVQARHRRSFWRRVNKEAPDGHWIWTGSLTQEGYTRHCWRHGVSRPASRTAWELTGQRRLEPDERLLHMCGERRCVNPEHLRPYQRARTDQA